MGSGGSKEASLSEGIAVCREERNAVPREAADSSGQKVALLEQGSLSPNDERKGILGDGSGQVGAKCGQGCSRLAMLLLVPDGEHLAEKVLSRRRTTLFKAPAMGAMDVHGHRIPGSQYIALGVWMALLMVEYAIVRVSCKFGFPQDCQQERNYVIVMQDYQYLVFMGFVLAIITGIHWPDRFQYVFSFRLPQLRGLWFVALFLATGPVWGLLDHIPGLNNFSLTGSQPGHVVTLSVLALGALALVAWHVHEAWRFNSTGGFIAYVLSRICLVAFYSVYFVLSRADKDISFHLHHYAVGFLAASLAEFNHPLSLVLLALGAGVFVQGIAAYESASMITDKHRITYLDNKNATVMSPLISLEAADWFASQCTFK